MAGKGRLAVEAVTRDQPSGCAFAHSPKYGFKELSACFPTLFRTPMQNHIESSNPTRSARDLSI